MLIAVEGCAHGELDKIYETIQHFESSKNAKVDLLLCCGDFQAVRNYADLKCMAVPQKYQALNTFYKYYSGECVAPVLTIFIGGNHEASNYLAELPYGGWVAPRIYYLGYAGVVNFRGLRIGGLSGIYNKAHYLLGHFEGPPYDPNSMRSCYHIRVLETFRLKQLKPGAMDIFLSHDWPQNIFKEGDGGALFRRKPFLRDDAESGRLGSRPTREVLDIMQPKYWFSAHLHVKFPALVQHRDTGLETKFLALDKCLPHRDFLQILEIPSAQDTGSTLSYDVEWLTILRHTDHLWNLTPYARYMPSAACTNERHDFRPTAEELAETCALFSDGDLSIPENFAPTAKAHEHGARVEHITPPPFMPNAQTKDFCAKLGLTDVTISSLQHNHAPYEAPHFDPTEEDFSGILCGDNGFGAERRDAEEQDETADAANIYDPDEIVLESELCEVGVTKGDVYPTTDVSEHRIERKCVVDSENGAGNNEVADTVQGSTPKKFKRRNAAMYASRDDDEDD